MARRLDSLNDMKEELRARGESLFSDAQAEATGYLELLRDAVADRLDGIDTKRIRRRADKLSASLTEAITDAVVESIDTVRQRVRPRRTRQVPVAMIAIGGAVIGFGIAAYFLGRRQEVRQKFTDLSGEAQRRVPQVIGKVKGGRSNGHVSTDEEESQLRQAVEGAIFAGTQPPGELRVDVEGRTVYLRGHLEDRSYVDEAVQRAQGVEGVAAVINLVSA